MEGIVISALGWLLANALSGIVGNQADTAVSFAWQAILDRLKKGGKPVNQDLQRSVQRSFILALKTICDECIRELETGKKEHARDISWLKHKRQSLDEELKAIEKAEYVEPPLESLSEVELFVLSDGSLARDKINEVRSKLIDAATKGDEPPQCYKEKVERQIFELMSLFFSDEIKSNERVRNIFEGQLLAQIDLRLQGQQLTVERIAMSLRDIAKDYRNQMLKRNAFLLGWDLLTIIGPGCKDKVAAADDIKARLQTLGVEVTYPDPGTQLQAYIDSLRLTLRSIRAQIEAKHGQEVLSYFVLSVNILLAIGRRDEPVSFSGILHALEVAIIPDNLRRELDELRDKYERGELADTDRGPLEAWAHRVGEYFLWMR